KRLDGSSPIVITLREKEGWQDRNSQIPEWIKFAEYLRDQGRDVLFVRDFDMAREPLPFPTYPEASLDTHIRLALYEAAACNFFVANGPVHLALFTERPMLAFIPVKGDDYEYWANTPTFWRDLHGVEQFGQMPWSRPDQRLVWGMDDFETIRKAWDDLLPR